MLGIPNLNILLYTWTKYLSFHIYITLNIEIDVSILMVILFHSSMNLFDDELLIVFNLICLNNSIFFRIIVPKRWFNIFCERLISHILKFLIWSIHRKSKLLWTRIFHMRLHSIGETRFYLWKLNFWKSQSRHLFYFLF